MLLVLPPLQADERSQDCVGEDGCQTQRDHHRLGQVAPDDDLFVVGQLGKLSVVSSY